MLGNLIIRFKKGEDSDIFESELAVGLDEESNLDEYIHNCIEDIIAHVSGEAVDNEEDISDLEYYFEESSDIDEYNLDYDWR